MNWLARQPFTRVALIGAVWIVLAPAVLYAAADLYLRWLIWRDNPAGGASFYSIRLDAASPGGVVVLAGPPIALLVAWWLLRRGR